MAAPLKAHDEFSTKILRWIFRRKIEMPGLIIAAPSSGSGKTTITLGLLRALRDQGIAVRGAKSGPDYIDPRFHEAACGQPCLNLDAWAMSAERIEELAAGEDLLLIEGAMGLYDGAPPDGRGAVADLARQLDLPVVLVVDASHMAQSIAPLVAGFAWHDARVKIAGLILNKVRSARHEAMLRAALAHMKLPILGAVHRSASLATPSRHLGLVQAGERTDLEHYLDEAASIVGGQVELGLLASLAAPRPVPAAAPPIPPARRHIAIARDIAFGFTYPHQIRDMIRNGDTVRYFSPLANDPVPPADLIYLPGGYPELHADTLAAATTFLESIKDAAQHTDIYGECGGYMALGESLTDTAGVSHKMAGLLPLQTSFAQRKLHLGYRVLTAAHGPMTGIFNGHEFHYASTIKAEGTPLFDALDAEGNALPPMGLREGRVAGSFAHIIERVLP